MLSDPRDINHSEAGTMTGWRSQSRPHRVAVVLFGGCDLWGVGTFLEALALAGERAAPDTTTHCRWQISLLSAQGGKIKGRSALQVWTEKADAQQYPGFDAVFVAAGDEEIVGRELAPMRAWLDCVRANATPLTWLGVQPGVVPHDEAARMWPAVAAGHHSDHAATGISYASYATPPHAGLVAALRLIGKEAGEGIARRVAEHFRAASRATLALVLADVSAGTPVEKVRIAARWLRDNCHRPVSVADAASVATMSERSLLRHFREEIGVAPSAYLLNARLALASRLLVDTDLPVDKIARRVGMGSGDHLAKVFRRNLRLSPLEYRHRQRYGHHKENIAGPMSRPPMPPADAPDWDRRRAIA